MGKHNKEKCCKDQNNENEKCENEELLEDQIIDEEIIEEEIEEIIEDEASILKTQLLRLQADFENYRTRQDKERIKTIRYANEDLIIKLLPVLDNFERAFTGADMDDNFIKGFKMIYDSFDKTIKDAGVTEMESTGEKFDANKHHAIMMEEKEGQEPDVVIETLQKGYMLGDKIIRPSMVKVSK